ncbi:tail fiber protein [Chryseobacterium gambrini]|uniref:Tail fiber protein n=1 Tax=Chryseobacterium gambrini TaxID=373672 RepID=A0AAJ1R4F1_9FLAO|nr:MULTISPECIES: tail fiber protein [Chryseobacterium]MDN4013811.1 tail fiber protein [Chryseobacterium gambrini]MDN4031138.1 tail fiber protein [Chryseobacterium gambrini]QWA37644.1 tail fiber protein [Chryseobacterium sp. ZHDP1]
MDEELIGTIKLFAGNFAPRGYMLCNGAILNISQNQALFSILGSVYGGDGKTTFALPNLNGRMPVGAGTSNTGKSVVLGEASGTVTNTLLSSNLPSIVSQLRVSKSNATTSTPSSSASIAVSGTQAGRDFTAVPSFINAAPDTPINSASVTFAGQNLPVNNMPPYLGLNYIICVNGIYPSRQ